MRDAVASQLIRDDFPGFTAIINDVVLICTKIRPVPGELRVCTIKPAVFQSCNPGNSV
jgi:hypothetical protein